jgi:ribosomal-protein-serine acetyltransferase
MSVKKPILLDLPEKIETPRLIVRCPRSGEGKVVNEAVLESWEDLGPWMPWARGKKPTIDESEENVRIGLTRWITREDLWMFIYDKKSGQYIGGTGLHRINWDIPAVEIGYWIRTSRSGEGIITESTNALTRFAFEFLKCKRVEIKCSSRNLKSVAVMERLGFEREALLRMQDSHPTEIGDSLIYSRLDSKGLPGLSVNW